MKNFPDCLLFKGLVPLFLGLVLAACPGKSDDEGPVILRVNDVPITLTEFEKELEFQLTYTNLIAEGEEKKPGQFTLDDVKARVINDSLIPLAAVRHAYRDSIPELLEKAEAIRKEIKDDKSNFAALSAENSTTSVAASQGRLGFFGRGSTLPYPLPRLAYGMEPGSVSGPFVSVVGCYIVYVKKIEKGVTDSLDRLDASIILLAFDEEPDFLQKTLPDLVGNTRVEIVDPSMGAYLREGE